MVKPSWRLIHFSLSFISALVLLIAILTGIVLSLEPIYAESQLPYSSSQAKSQNIQSLLELIDENYEDVFELRRNDHYGYTIGTFEGDFEINLITGDRIENSYKRPLIFELALSLHRSLFLKTPGRLIVGIASFFLLLITISGLVVTIKKIGFKNLLKGFEKTRNHAYFHTYFTRIFFIPIFIIALSGTYLSMVRFQLVDTDQSTDPKKESSTEKLNVGGVFSDLTIGQLVKIEFPFSDDPEEYFNLLLEDQTIEVSQADDRVYNSVDLSTASKLKALSFNLHTGWSSILWSLALFLSSCAMLYFMYSGFRISYDRLSKKSKNVFSVGEAEVLVLVGSENGQTRLFADLVFKALLALNKKVIVQDMNAIKLGPKTQELIILTSTYGEGEAPNSGNRFLRAVNNVTLDTPIKFSVLGFGSTNYPLYCQFAKDVQEQMSELNSFSNFTPLAFVNKNNYKDFKTWINSYNETSGLTLNIPDENALEKKKQYKFFLENKWSSDDGTGITFYLELSTKQSKVIKSGDLLSIHPNSNEEARLYSVGKLGNGNLFLVIKLHEFGVCSNFLNDLELGAYFIASQVVNPHFHLDKSSDKLLLIANGSGVAPFIGMIHENASKKDIHLIWGVRNKVSLEPILEIIEPIQKKNRTKLELVYSRESPRQRYVQDALAEQENYIQDHLNNRGTIMICGSLSMLKGVLKKIDELYLDKPDKSSEYYIEQGQILSDCY